MYSNFRTPPSSKTPFLNPPPLKEEELYAQGFQRMLFYGLAYDSDNNYIGYTLIVEKQGVDVTFTGYQLYRIYVINSKR